MLKKNRKSADAPNNPSQSQFQNLLSEREAVVSFAETQMDIDPNNMPSRALTRFTRQEDDHILSMLENVDKKLVQQNKQTQLQKAKQKYDEKTKVTIFTN